MKYLYIAYFILRESFIYIIRNRTITALSIAVTSFSLFIIAFFLNVVENLSSFTNNIMNELNVNIYLLDNITPIQRKYIEKILNNSGYVASYEYIDKEKALQDFLLIMPNFKSIINNLKENPVPSSYKITLKKQYNSENAIKNFISLFQDGEGIDEIYYDKIWFDKLTNLIKLMKFIGVLVGSVFLFTALFTVANVIRLVVYGRKDEVEILKLVGASNFYIKAPFVLEGIFQGLTSSIISLIGVYFSYRLLIQYVEASGVIEAEKILTFLSSNMQMWVVILGVGIGFIGSFLSVSHVLSEKNM